MQECSLGFGQCVLPKSEFQLMELNTWNTNMKQIEPQTSLNELNILCSCVAYKASIELCELGERGA